MPFEQQYICSGTEKERHPTFSVVLMWKGEPYDGKVRNPPKCSFCGKDAGEVVEGENYYDLTEYEEQDEEKENTGEPVRLSREPSDEIECDDCGRTDGTHDPEVEH